MAGWVFHRSRAAQEACAYACCSFPPVLDADHLACVGASALIARIGGRRPCPQLVRKFILGVTVLCHSAFVAP